jgi:tol-pal system protein YbgF
VEVQQGEQQAYDAALSQFKSGDYKAASQAFAAFLRTYPKSGYTAAANYWMGNAYYAQKDYAKAIAAQQVVATSYADNPKAPDAMLNIASSYTEMKDRAAAKKALESLIAKYPDSNAAQTARQRLGSIK